MKAGGIARGGREQRERTGEQVHTDINGQTDGQTDKQTH